MTFAVDGCDTIGAAGVTTDIGIDGVGAAGGGTAGDATRGVGAVGALGGITGGANGCDVIVRGCVTRGAIGGDAGGTAGAIGRGGTNGIAPDGRGGCIGGCEPGAVVGRGALNGARGGVLPVTPTDGNGRGVLAGPEPGIGGGSGGTS